jgi:hypothetical protein
MKDVFLSYTGEDGDFAKEIAAALRFVGFDVWFAPLSLIVGEKLLDSIERGMNESTAGILLLSPNYLTKPWPNYEMDTLIRQHIERGKPLLPIWHNVSKRDVERRHAGLAGIVAVSGTQSAHAIAAALSRPLSRNAPTVAVIPIWESPRHRFLQGTGEIHLGNAEGPAASLWELLLHLKDDQYPLYLEGQRFTKQELIIQAWESLNPLRQYVLGYVGEEGYERIRAMCLAEGLDPDLF